MDLLKGEFGEHFILSSGPVKWPCGLTPLDYFYEAILKLMSIDKPASIDALEDNTEAFIREKPAEILERVCTNWTKRMDHLKRSRRQHLHGIIFQH